MKSEEKENDENEEMRSKMYADYKLGWILSTRIMKYEIFTLFRYFLITRYIKIS